MPIRVPHNGPAVVTDLHVRLNARPHCPHVSKFDNADIRPYSELCVSVRDVNLACPMTRRLLAHLSANQPINAHFGDIASCGHPRTRALFCACKKV